MGVGGGGGGGLIMYLFTFRYRRDRESWGLRDTPPPERGGQLTGPLPTTPMRLQRIKREYPPLE